MRNNLADAVGSINLRAAGTAEDTVISGSITATRGTIVFRNERFEIQRAIIDVAAAPATADPLVNIQAEARSAATASASCWAGRSERPRHHAQLRPALPQADIAALVTTGTSPPASRASRRWRRRASAPHEPLDREPDQRARPQGDRQAFRPHRFEFEPLAGAAAAPARPRA